MITKVIDLRTGDRQYYSLPPNRAVVCAYRQSIGDWNTADYDYSIAKVSQSGKTVACGDFCTLFRQYVV
jgi:hypothetical protein